MLVPRYVVCLIAGLVTGGFSLFIPSFEPDFKIAPMKAYLLEEVRNKSSFLET